MQRVSYCVPCNSAPGSAKKKKKHCAIAAKPANARQELVTRGAARYTMVAILFSAEPSARQVVMDDAGSVTEWLNVIKAGDAQASQKLWERYVGEVVRIAQRRLGARPRRAADEHDVAQEAFASFFRCAEEGRFARLDDRNDLWQVLVLLTDRKAKQLLRRELADKRGA